MTKFTMPYGRDEMEIDVPKKNLITGPVEARCLPPLPNAEEAIKEAVENPIGSAPLSALVKPRGKVVITVASMIRPGKHKKIVLPVIIEKLHKGGVKDKDIMIIDAVGSVVPDTQEDWIEMFGEGVLEKVKVINHDPVKHCVYLGRSEKYDDPIFISKYVAEAGLVIAIDKICLSNAGYTGGAKMFAVGVASLDTINSTHVPSCFFHQSVRLGEYKGNIFRDRLNGIGRKAEQESKSKKFFIINTVQNIEDEIAGVFAGDMVEAWHMACELADKQFKVPVPKTTDILFLGVPYPHSASAQDLSAELCFAMKTYPVPIVKEGGVAIFVAPLDETPTEGTTEYELLQIMRSAFDPEDVIKLGEEWEKKFREEGKKIPRGVVRAYQRGRYLRHLHGNVFVVGPKHPGLVRDLHYKPVRTAERALETAFKIAGKDADIIVVPNVRDVAPQVKI